MPGHSRSALAQLIDQEAVLLNGRPAAKSAKPAAGDRLEVLLPDPEPMNAEPENIPLDIVYEDDRLLVVNKPKGMVVHPAPGNYQGTLVNALLYHCAGSLSGIGGQLRPGIVHRIDKNTSGLLVVAKDDAAHTALSAQMACHSIHRLYQAVVYGGFKQDSGFVEGNIGRSPQDRKKMALVARGGKPAYTGWQVLDRYKGFTHLQLQLKTGRTHQIRVHMASIGRGRCLRAPGGDPQPGRPVPARQDFGVRPSRNRGVYGVRFPSAGVFHTVSANAEKGRTMNKPLENLLVVCDIDNTLVTADMELPACNLEMIRLFCAMGGRFTLATGRTPVSARTAAAGVPVNAPVIACGGGLIFDFDTGEVISRHTLDSRQGARLVADVLEKFPDTGVEIMAGDGDIYIVQSSAYTDKHIRDEQLACRYAPLEEVPDGWLKILFADRPTGVQNIAAFLQNRSYAGLVPVMTNHIYFEIMPENINKAAALREICQNISFPLANTVAIGDYYNDIELLKAAGHSVAMGNAPAEVKMAASETTGDCREGGLASYLYRLIKQNT